MQANSIPSKESRNNPFFCERFSAVLLVLGYSMLSLKIPAVVLHYSRLMFLSFLSSRKGWGY